MDIVANTWMTTWLSLWVTQILSYSVVTSLLVWVDILSLSSYEGTEQAAADLNMWLEEEEQEEMVVEEQGEQAEMEETDDIWNIHMST